MTPPNSEREKKMKRQRIRRWAYRRWLHPLVAEQVSLTLIAWRTAGNLIGTKEHAEWPNHPSAELDTPND